jgi:hypothetical protein
MGAEIEPQAVFISEAVGAATGTTGALSARLIDASRWHYIRSSDDRALCGLVIPSAASKVLWADTAADERCPWCVGRLKP